MKKLNLSILASFLFATLILTSCGELGKMAKMASQVRYEVTPKVLEMHGDSVKSALKVTFPTKFFQKKAVLEITPVLKYEGGEQAFKTLYLQGESVQANNQKVSYISGGTFSTASTIKFVEGMRRATLVGRVVAKVGDKTQDLPEVKLADGVMATALLLEKDAKVIMAGDDFVRVTTNSKEADIHFLINKSNIQGKELRDEDIKALKEYVKTNATAERVEFKGVEISAYASPDGELDLNTSLADKRMKTAKDYFAKELKKAKVKGLDNPELISTNTTPEDWDGFKTLMQESDIQDKELILRVLSMYSDPVVREREIKNISAAYKTIADNVLPQLRRSKMTVNVAVVGYSDDELKDLAKTSPDSLNVEELMYAATLFSDLDTKLDIYKKVKSNFSSDWRGHNNVGCILYKQGKLDAAKTEFEGAKEIDASNATVLNNLGAIAYMKGDVDGSKEFYKAAAGAGGEVSYNHAIIAAQEGNYENALNLFASSKINSFNFALVKMLNYSNTKNADAFDAALGILKNVEDQEAANVYYLKAILGARKQDSDMLFNNLRTAIEKDKSYASYALKDIEFAQYAEDGMFKSILD